MQSSAAQGGGMQMVTVATCASVAGASGIYLIDPDGDGPNAPFSAFCEQTIDGGGWTMVGRSAPMGNGAFGWRTDTGAVDDESNPYSLNPLRASLPFDQVLVLSDDDAPDQGFIIDVPVGFLMAYQTTSVNTTGAVRHAVGACNPPGGAPAMLRYIGQTASDIGFFLRDFPMIEGYVYGLRPDGFSLNYTDCNDGGSLHGRQGALFVR